MSVPSLEFEPIKHNMGVYLCRARVPGGWIVMASDDVITQSENHREQTGLGFRTSITFIPDINWSWGMSVESMELEHLLNRKRSS